MYSMRRVISGLLVGLVVWMMALVATAQEGKDKEGYLSVPIGTIVLEPPQGAEATKNPVEFPHGTHFIYNCKECHHAWELDAQLKTCTTAECHDLLKVPKKDGSAPAVAGIRFFKRAFHQRCIGCHREIKKQNTLKEKSLRLSDKNLVLQKTGPTGCVDCHPKD